MPIHNILTRFGRCVPVLMYHHISPRHDDHTVQPATFRSQLDWLHSNGYVTVSAAEFELIRKGEFVPEYKPVLLTFDDGWLDNYIYTLPILKEYQAKALFFIVTSWPGDQKERSFSIETSAPKTPTHADAMRIITSEKRDDVVMRWSEIEAALATGLVDFHSHSHSHGQWWSSPHDLGHLKDALEQDLTMSRAVLKQKLGISSNHFCWPKGMFIADLVALASQSGFSQQYTTLCGVNSYDSDKLIRRLNIAEKDISTFKRRITLYGGGITGQVAGLAHRIKQAYNMNKFVKSQGLKP